MPVDKKHIESAKIGSNMTKISNAVWTQKELSEINNVDRILPCQPYFSKFYNHDKDEYFHRMEKLMLSMHHKKCVQDKFSITLKDDVTYASLGSEISTLYFYQMLIRMGKYKNILELGTYIGVSTLFLAEATDGEVTTVEYGKEFFDIASKNFETNGYHINQIHGDAKQVLIDYAEIGKKFDFILIDAAKESYDSLLILSISCLSRDGVILVDDIFFQGESLNDHPNSVKGMGVRRMLDIVDELSGFEKVILPIGNGLLMLRKQNATI